MGEQERKGEQVDGFLLAVLEMSQLQQAPALPGRGSTPGNASRPERAGENEGQLRQHDYV